MQPFYNEEGECLGRAWSAAIQCDDVDRQVEHPPHVHDPKFARFGPYMCAGYPKTKLYLTPKREPVN